LRNMPLQLGCKIWFEKKVEKNRMNNSLNFLCLDIESNLNIIMNVINSL
jgi:hypothetical protein